jgi:predicted acetyltransferase
MLGKMSPIAPWLLPILWREHDWSAALERLSVTATRANRLTGARAHRTAIELALALEYIEPDRRRAIPVYELAGDHERACELAAELGWWSGRARLSARIIDSPQHVLDEAAAWWDAGHPDLCALALSEVRGADRGIRGAELAALVASRDLQRHAAEAVAHAQAAKGREAANAYLMAARFCRAAGELDQVTRWLEVAVATDPKHTVAARFLLELAMRSRDPAGIKRFLKVRLEGADFATSLGAIGACGLSLVESDHHRGFAQRLLRQILDKAYDLGHAPIPGHIAMWTAVASYAAAATTRRELLPFVIKAMHASQTAVDRVWLAALATDISLREGNNPVVAGAYAEIVAEHAPDHPIVRALVSTVAVAIEDEPTSPIAIPMAAIKAAKEQVYDEVVIDLDVAYAEAANTDDDDAPAAIVSTAASPTPWTYEDAIAEPAPPPKPKGIPRVASMQRTAPLPLATKKPYVPAPQPVAEPAKRPPPPSPGLPPIPSPVLAALRTPNRPVVPPRPADPPNAVLRARRIAVPIDVRMLFADGSRTDGTSRDISTTGLFVLGAATLTIHDELTIELLLPGKEAFTEDEYRAAARVVRRGDDGFGLELVDPDPALVAALDGLF